MAIRLLHPDEYDLVTRSSFDSQDTFNVDEADFVSRTPRAKSFYQGQSLLTRLISTSFVGYHRITSPARCPRTRRHRCYHRLIARRACFFLYAGLALLIAFVSLTFLFWPSYTYPPPHYRSLRQAVLQLNSPGRGNPRSEKVFIAAILYDPGGTLAGGQWGTAVRDLIHLLGEENVFLSIYESDSGEEGHRALQVLKERLVCNKSIVSEERFNFTRIPKVTLPDGSQRVRRIAYLAEMRNLVLEPLEEPFQPQYDRLLYLNDVMFDPIDALQLLFSTNIDQEGVAQYRAACAVDFINAFKFYDTFATRDLHGYGMGLPFFPWFTSAGSGRSRQDVLEERDAVRVRSCWGGMVAFDAKFFQDSRSSFRRARREKQLVPTLDLPPAKNDPRGPVRFRAEEEMFWEASECCLIHADIQVEPTSMDEVTDGGIYLNPFVRVAYDSTTHSWLWTTRRFERLYAVAHDLATRVAGLPFQSPRRAHLSGDEVVEEVWVPDAMSSSGGTFQMLKRTATKGGFCGGRGLQVIVEDRQLGQDGWESIPPPE